MQWIQPGEIELIIPLLLATLAGCVIGIEREIHHKASGIGTNMLIAAGACLFTLISERVDVDSTSRIAANIVQGIGFLGAGVIFRDTTNAVRGLTSAAGIWLTAAVGMAIGFEFFALAGIATLIAIVAPQIPWWFFPKHHLHTVAENELKK